MEAVVIRNKIVNQIQHMLDHAIITDRRFLDDEQLIRSEQLAVLEEVFNANVRDAEIHEISSHFAPILRGDHPVHLALWGKTGTGKTLTMIYFLNLLADMCRRNKVAMQHKHIDLSTPRPCFRALNDLACMLNASKRYKKGISLEELMLRIEASLDSYRGYLVLFVDEVDNVRRDKDTFLSFLVRRLPQRIPARLVLVFASNRLNWSDNLDPRVRSFLKLNELVFKPYDAVDLQHILKIRVQKALRPGTVESGVIEKIAALASRDHGDARRAVALLARSAYLAEKAGSTITLDLVDQSADQIEQDKYLTMIRTAPVQLQAAMASVISAAGQTPDQPVGTGQAYDSYRRFCDRTGLRPLTARAFGGLPRACTVIQVSVIAPASLLLGEAIADGQCLFRLARRLGCLFRRLGSSSAASTHTVLPSRHTAIGTPACLWRRIASRAPAAIARSINVPSRKITVMSFARLAFMVRTPVG